MNEQGERKRLQRQAPRRKVVDSEEPDFARLETAVQRLVSQQRTMLGELDARATELQSLRSELAEREARLDELETALDDAGERRTRAAERLDALISHVLELEGRVEQLGASGQGAKVRPRGARGGATSPSPA
jgi:chromosome segregation ATPase